MQVECSNGQTGYGRRRREVASIPADPNKVFEVTMSTYIRVDYKGDDLLEKGKRILFVIMLHHVVLHSLPITWKIAQNISVVVNIFIRSGRTSMRISACRPASIIFLHSLSQILGQ